MAARVQDLSALAVSVYGGDVTRLWSEATTGAELSKRIQALPGFGKQKAQIFVALLAKQVGMRPRGWNEAAGDYALKGYRPVADVVDEASMQEVRDCKKQKKLAAAVVSSGN